MRIGATISFANPPDSVVSDLESRSIDSFWFYEIFQGYEAFARAGYLAAKTNKAQIAVGVVNSYSRHPAIVAMGASFLSNFTKGRASVVVGVGGDSWVGNMLGYDQRHPRARVKEFVTALRRLLKGEEVTHRSANFALNQVKLFPTPQHHVPIIMAVEQPRMMALAGQIADGVYLEPSCCPTGYVKWASQTVSRQSSRCNGFRVIANLPLFVTDGDLGEVRSSVKPMLAFHLSFPGEGELYLERAGFPASLSEKIGETSGVRKRIREGRSPTEVFGSDSLKKAAELVPDDFVDQCSVMGDIDACKDRLRELEKAGLTDVVFTFQDDRKDDLAILTDS